MNDKNISKKKRQGKSLTNSLRFALLPFATLLYGYGIASLATVFAIVVICILRSDLLVFRQISFETALTIIIGTIIFLPAKKLRREMLSNPK